VTLPHAKPAWPSILSQQTAGKDSAPVACEAIRTPYLTQASLAVERKLGKGANYVSIDYTMVRGIELYRMRNINAPLPGTGAPPDPNFINIDQFESSGRSRSHSVTLSVHTTVGKRIDLLGQYAFSKALDDTSGMFS
jgi:hypothetical protein